MFVDKNLEGVTRLVGAVVNNRGEWYGLYQKLEDGVIYWGVNRWNETANGDASGDICAYRDLGYLARMKGFSL